MSQDALAKVSIALEPIGPAISTKGQDLLQASRAARRSARPLSFSRLFSVDAATRLLDLVIGLVLIVFFLPLMALIAVSIFLCDSGPPVFFHERIGRGGVPFFCLKFRTMVRDADRRLEDFLASNPQAFLEWQRDRKLRVDPRVTFVGRFLRRSSLDELPQLFNVLAGHMSLVGPRPITPKEVDRYQHYYRHYIAVRPGLSGLWQISGRNDVSYRRRVCLDVAFVRNRSVKLYLSIAIRTPGRVLLSAGCY